MVGCGPTAISPWAICMAYSNLGADCRQPRLPLATTPTMSFTVNLESLYDFKPKQWLGARMVVTGSAPPGLLRSRYTVASAAVCREGKAPPPQWVG